ncbi:TPA: hypothetical protein I8Y16_005102, partial [Raoultella ornithinolytica]|nr:hypothetical protein [Raoultella ornithinolytica]
GLNKFNLHGLSEEGYVPHVTLYLSTFKKNKLSDLINTVNEISENRQPFFVQINEIEKTKSGWLMLNVKNNIELQILSDEITTNVFRYRESSLLPLWTRAFPEKRKYFEKYGSPNVFNEFEPHITVLYQGNEVDIDRYLHENTLHPFMADIIGIGISESDQFGQHKHAVYEAMF